MKPDSIITALVTVLTSSGFVATVTTLIGVVVKARAGQKLREPARREQIAEAAGPTERELEAHARAVDAERAFDAERALRRAWQDLAHELRRYCIDHGTPLSALPPFPDDPQPHGGTP